MNTALTLAMNVKAGDVIVRQATDGGDIFETVRSVEIIGGGRMRMFGLECGGKTYSYSDRNTKTVRVVAQ